VTKKGLYVGQEPYYCAISCGFLQNLSINPRFFRSVYASRKKDDPSPFCHRSGPKFFRPSLVVCLQTEDLSGGRTGIHIANAAWGVKRCVGHGILRFSFQLFLFCGELAPVGLWREELVFSHKQRAPNNFFSPFLLLYIVPPAGVTKKGSKVTAVGPKGQDR